MTTAIAQVRQQLTQMGPEIAKVLPEHVTTDRFERVTLTALQRSPDLLGCDRKSLFESVMQCAADGLQPDGREAALTKFGNKVAYMPMVAGILKKIRQSGDLATITAHVVYEADQFDYWIDDEGEHLTHRPEMLGEPGNARAVYAMARTTDGSVYIEVLRMSDIDRIRKASRSGGRGPWADWWDQMAKKSAIRRLAKRLPMSTDLERVVQRDDQFYPYQDASPRDVTPSQPSASDALAALTDEPEQEPVVTDDDTTAQPAETITEAETETETDTQKDVF